MPEDPSIGVDERPLDDAALEALAAAHATPPPPRLRGRILAAARREQERERRMRRLASRWRVVGAVAAGLVVVLGGLLGREAYNAGRLAWDLTALRQTNTELSARVDRQERTLAGLREAVAAQAEVLRVLAAPRTLSAALAPKAGAAGGGRVLVDAASGETAVVLSGMTVPGEGKTYELWAIRGDQPPEPAGLFAVGAGGAIAARGARVDDPGAVTAFAVSIEPAGGSPTPTGPIVLVGAVTG
jgi:anti-sigma-K factor RskA